MNKINTKFPVYLGFALLVLSVLTVSVKVGEKTMIQTGLIKANQNIANLSLALANPDLISLNLISANEVAGGDFVIKYNPKYIEVLPSTLEGNSGYVTTGGENDGINGTFSFSVINSESPLKTGSIANFRIRNKVENQPLSNITIDFDTQLSKIIDSNSQSIIANFSGLN